MDLYVMKLNRECEAKETTFCSWTEATLSRRYCHFNESITRTLLCSACEKNLIKIQKVQLAARKVDALEKQNVCFDELSEHFDDLNARFGELNEHFDELNERFDEINERLNGLAKRLNQQVSSDDE